MKLGKQNFKNKVALIGYGYWGKKIYLTLSQLMANEQIVVVDPQIKKITEGMQLATLDEVLQDQKIDHVLIVTPEETHFELAKKCLEHHKHTFVEKPLCLHKNEAQILLRLAKKNQLNLAVDYTFLFDPYIIKLKKLVDQGKIGKLKHIESIRHSININKPQVTVFDDLATHDLYLGRLFFGTNPSQYTSVKEKINSNQTNQALVQLNYGPGTLSAHYSWIQPQPARKLILIGDTGTLVWDRNEPELLLYKKQELKQHYSVKQVVAPLTQSLKSFFQHQTTSDYLHDVTMLEKLDLS